MESIDQISLVLNAYKLYQESNQDEFPLNKEALALIHVYRKYTCTVQKEDSSDTDDSTVLHKALKFCQEQSNNFTAQNASISVEMSEARKSPMFKAVLSEDTTQYYNLEAEKEVRDLSIRDKSPKRKAPQCDLDRVSTLPPPPVIQLPKGQITMVEHQGTTYTRIGPPTGLFVPSPHSAFRPTLPLDGKRPRMDPGLQHLLDPGKPRVSRSISTPLYPEGEENTPPHRMLFRTGSFVSDLTKQKLKNSILDRTSAALVKKPSITDYEMMQIRSKQGYDDDSDSSQSEEDSDYFDDDQDVPRKRKYSEEVMAITGEHAPLVPPHQSTVITTAAGST